MVNSYSVVLENRCPVLKVEASFDCKNIVSSPEDIFKIMNSCFSLGKRAEEYVYIIGLDTSLHITGISEVSHGTVSASMCNPREIFIRALSMGAERIMVLHNHPSGDVEPSPIDDETAERLRVAGKILGVRVADFVIISNDNFYSYFWEKRCGYIDG